MYSAAMVPPTCPYTPGTYLHLVLANPVIGDQVTHVDVHHMVDAIAVPASVRTSPSSNRWVRRVADVRVVVDKSARRCRAYLARFSMA